MDIFSEAGNLVRRYEKGDAFRHHVHERKPLVVGVFAALVVISIALSLGLLAHLEKGGLLAFLALVLTPIVLIGSLAMQAYLFFSWLELRALKPMLAPGAAPVASGTWLARLRSRLGKAPPIPWIPVAVLLLLPFLVLLLASLKIAALVLVLAALTPVAYAHFDQ
jgi:hypothetical protein